MAITGGGTEIVDISGSTSHYNGTVNTSSVNIPSTPSKIISEIFISVPRDQAITNVLLVSFDGGINFTSFYSGGSFIWTPKGNKTQFQIKGSTTGVKYEIIVNFER